MTVTPPTALKGVQRVLVFRALQLGDLLCAVPALRALRQTLPKAHIALLSLPWACDFVRRYATYLDEFIEFPGFPGLPERTPDLAQFPEFLRAMQRRRFDLTIQMHGSGGIVNNLLALFAAKHNAGYCESSDACSDTRRFLVYPHSGHEVHRHLQLVNFLGAPGRDDALEFPLYCRDFEELSRLPEAARLRGGQYVCLHAGARYLTRRWPIVRLAAVGDHFARQGLAVVLTGSQAERELTAELASCMQTRAIDLAGRTSLGAAAALVSGARIVITNDTGMSHLSAAVGVPSVVVVLSSDAARWAPLDAQLHPTLLADVACRPCEHRVCPIGFGCADKITSAAVIERAERLLRESDGGLAFPDSTPSSQEVLCAPSAS